MCSFDEKSLSDVLCNDSNASDVTDFLRKINVCSKLMDTFIQTFIY